MVVGGIAAGVVALGFAVHVGEAALRAAGGGVGGVEVIPQVDTVGLDLRRLAGGQDGGSTDQQGEQEPFHDRFSLKRGCSTPPLYFQGCRRGIQRDKERDHFTSAFGSAVQRAAAAGRR